MAAENATETLQALQAQWEADRHRQEQALAELQQALGLAGSAQPDRMLRYLQYPGHCRGRQHGGIRAGRAARRHYRHFNIRSVNGPDDFASMEEVLTRRFNRWKAAQELADSSGQENRPGFCPAAGLAAGGWRQRPARPGSDGAGAIQLERNGACRRLAKQKEELFVPGRSELHPAAAPIAGLVPDPARAR